MKVQVAGFGIVVCRPVFVGFIDEDACLISVSLMLDVLKLGSAPQVAFGASLAVRLGDRGSRGHASRSGGLDRPGIGGGCRGRRNRNCRGGRRTRRGFWTGRYGGGGRSRRGSMNGPAVGGRRDSRSGDSRSLGRRRRAGYGMLTCIGKPLMVGLRLLVHFVHATEVNVGRVLGERRLVARGGSGLEVPPGAHVVAGVVFSLADDIRIAR